ncbi:MAG: metallophosphoesterase [Clostridia bacterium]
MAVFTISDLHLSFGTNKPMDVFRGWEDYTIKLFNNWNSIVTQEDTVIICGDISWAMNDVELLPDLKFIESLNGKKILLKGNHDYWFSSAKKLNELLEKNNIKSIRMLHNNAFEVENYSICGTRGWILENKKLTENDNKIIAREALRLQISIDAAQKFNKEIICFLHYPPIYDNFESAEIIDVMKKANVKKCYYGHIHSKARNFSVFGEYQGITYSLVACDSINFTPIRI